MEVCARGDEGRRSVYSIQLSDSHTGLMTQQKLYLHIFMPERD